MPQPPPLPADKLRRVLRISGFDGYTLVFIAGGFGLVSLTTGDWLGWGVGTLAAVCGLIELRGRRQLRSGELRGLNALISSQLLVLALILGYLAYQIGHYDPRPMIEMVDHALAEALQAQGQETMTLADWLGLTKPQLLALAKSSARQTYIAAGLLSVLCQGGLAYYYHRKRPDIARALRKS